jgi:hypothetical protein
MICENKEMLLLHNNFNQFTNCDTKMITVPLEIIRGLPDDLTKSLNIFLLNSDYL